MKKLLTVLAAVLLILAFVGCSEQADAPVTPEETPLVVDLTPAPTEQASPTPTSAEAGVTIGDILFNDIPISQLFTEPFIGVLGDPIYQHGAFFSYEGLEIMGDRGDLVGHDNMAIHFHVFAPYLGLFELNGVSLDMTRAELIAAFGAHPYHGFTYEPTFQISSPTIDYLVSFRFEHLSDDTPVSSISMFRPHDQWWDDNTVIIRETTPEQLVGTWKNDTGETYVISHEIPQGEDWVMTRFPSGAYLIIVESDSPAHYEKWFFPVGVEMVRYGTNWSLVPSDTSRARLFVGTFTLTACCPDEEILLEVFYRTSE